MPLAPIEAEPVEEEPSNTGLLPKAKIPEFTVTDAVGASIRVPPTVTVFPGPDAMVIAAESLITPDRVVAAVMVGLLVIPV